jgi:hypothetical protein
MYVFTAGLLLSLLLWFWSVCAVVGGKVYPKLKAITSVVASGTYMADNDGHTHDEEVKVTTVYTGMMAVHRYDGSTQV